MVERVCANFDGTVHEWRCPVGSAVRQNATLAVLQRQSDDAFVDVLAPADGKVSDVTFVKGERVRKGQTLCEISPGCAHTVVIGGLCALCGVNVDAVPVSAMPHNNVDVLVHGHRISMAERHIYDRGEEHTRKLMDRKQLVLVLDLDHTLLHTTLHGGVYAELRRQCAQNDDFNVALKDVHIVTRQETPHYVKLRPGVHEFLQRMRPMFDMHVYTMGLRDYAEECVRILDPQRTLFRDRVMARDDLAAEQTRKQLRRLVHANGSLIVVLDDRVDVWGDMAKHVLNISRFNYWPGPESLRTGPEELANGSLSNIRVDAQRLARHSQETVLQSIGDVLERVHRQFFEAVETGQAEEVHVAALLRGECARVLRGCHVVFCGVYPDTGSGSDTAEWHLAQSLGAKCHEIFSENNAEKITHVVSALSSHAKVELALRTPGVRLVTPRWLHTCHAFLRRADEFRFQLAAHAVASRSEWLRRVSARTSASAGTASARTDESDAEFKAPPAPKRRRLVRGFKKPSPRTVPETATDVESFAPVLLPRRMLPIDAAAAEELVHEREITFEHVGKVLTPARSRSRSRSVCRTTASRSETRSEHNSQRSDDVAGFAAELERSLRPQKVAAGKNDDNDQSQAHE